MATGSVPVWTIAVRCNVRGSIRQIALVRGSRTHSEPMPTAITGGTNGSGRSLVGSTCGDVGGVTSSRAMPSMTGVAIQIERPSAARPHCAPAVRGA